MFTIDPVKSKNGQFTFNRGGFQDARELDAETEWFFNTTTKTLYYYNNYTGAPAADQFEATNLKLMFALVGNLSYPISNIIIRGLTLRDTQYTYMDGHGMPSGGDWALQRTGAIYLDCTFNVSISNNLMTRLDGNAISINRYNRYTVVTNNEIVWNGDSAITSWGVYIHIYIYICMYIFAYIYFLFFVVVIFICDTNGISFPGLSNNASMGWDGTNDNQPRGLTITQNYVHELGIWEKQSSFYFQAKSCQNFIAYNIFYNGPRAGINFNDGFGGNSHIYKNLLFNTCRESGDHGPFNSWDRQVYVTEMRNGSPLVTKADDEISYNFFIANYNSQEAIDNDDGSCYYYTHHNFFVYSGNGMKNDFGGHDNKHEFNIYGMFLLTSYIGQGFSINAQLLGHNDAYFNNTVVLTSDIRNYGSFDCTSSQATWPVLGNNVVSTPSGNTSSTGLCDLPLQEFQNKFSADLGSVIESWPSDQALLQQATNLLF
ncbi:hypothetical protein RFI_01057 [Reticulomyxa filosa]|uniref:Right handed beta helix domain-containing protein n=1 Tax=Reticulomyxa filosa TaxID=46433 RepID=X6PBX3_RETFI|nr:hypothetical protein RFI_01057 [Reticulomyxa filosa]|eukprot:ETO36005.1 hypothetical protein RFI_01057 [Reticulomyxa filosa]